jgi:hypothetical protein
MVPWGRYLTYIQAGSPRRSVGQQIFTGLGAMLQVLG